MVFELLPDLDWDKGHAAAWLLDALAPGGVALYAGDDVTDETVFRALAGQGFGILVGDAARVSAARFSLRDPAEVVCFLDALAERLERR